MPTIVITGGPCAGKTTALSFLASALEEHGWQVVLVPECATALIAAGIAPWTSSRLDFQTAVFELQLAQEDVFVAASRRVKADHVLVICDRGLMDGKGYLSDEEFDALLEAHGLTEHDANARYDAVYHLESTAKGIQRAYTLENNASRFEDSSEAISVDERIVASWASHPHRVLIQNEDRFEQKATHLLNEVLAFLGQA
ncbi:MAG: ATP-binding protein [Atopobiaceae bacterium]|nr:ATP-binding protein [Atopobiaceae bacterium]